MDIEEEKLYYENIGRDLTCKVRIFNTVSGEIEDLPLWSSVSFVCMYNKLRGKEIFVYVTNETYPMYDINNDYMGYVDNDGVFQNKREEVYWNKRRISFTITFLIGALLFIFSDSSDVIAIGLGTLILSFLGFIMTDREWGSFL